MKSVIALVSITVVLLLSGCGLFNLFTDYSHYYENTKNTAPVFTESASRSLQNAAAHTFQLNTIVSDTAIAGKGVSQGAGSVMLFKYQDMGIVKYIVVPADADPADLPLSAANYTTWVVEQPFLTTADQLTDTSQLNAGNLQAGTIYLNYYTYPDPHAA